nr:hypothetical protein [Ferrimicrobium acidiphilum]
MADKYEVTVIGGVSLTSFLDRNPQVGRGIRMLLGPVEGPNPIMWPLAAPIGSRDPPLSGTAVDYMLRFEIERRFPQSWTDQWIAERSEQILREGAETEGTMLGFDPEDKEARRSVELSKRAHQLVVAARKSHRRFVRLRRPTLSDLRRMACHSVLLAKLDGVYRARKRLTASDLAVADEDVVEDVLAMLGAIPNDGVLGFPEGDGIWLNPSFGPYSDLVTGADADLIVGDTIVDVKAHRHPSFEEEAPQLVGYALLANGARTLPRRYFSLRIPQIRRVGIYWARHGQIQFARLRSSPGDPIYQTIARGFFRSVLQETIRPVGGLSGGFRRPWHWWGRLLMARERAGFVSRDSDRARNAERGVSRTETNEIEVMLDSNPYTATAPHAEPRVD